MLWLDGFLSVPGLGIRTKPNRQLISTFQERLTYFIDHICKEYDDVEVKILDIWGYSIIEKKFGLFFDISPNNIYFHSAYQILEKLQPGSLPVYDIPSVSNYSELLEKIFGYIEKLLEIIQSIEGFTYDRIGIIADANLNKESLPPGVIEWIKNLGKPWDGQLMRTETILLCKLSEKENYFDQCHHHIKFDDTIPEQGYRLKFDWQRMFKEPISLEYKKTSDAIVSCKEEALNYFEKFGEGELNYG